MAHEPYTSDTQRLNYGTITFPSAKLIIGELPETSFTRLSQTEQAVADTAFLYARGFSSLAKPAAATERYLDFSTPLDQSLIRMYMDHGIAQGPHQALELIRTIKRQAIAQGRTVMGKSEPSR
jgi:hypothetical protein